MAQLMTTEDGGNIKDQPLKEGEIRPNDLTKVYSTALIGDYQAAGTMMEVHPELAKKLIASGKATEAAPSKKDK